MNNCLNIFGEIFSFILIGGGTFYFGVCLWALYGYFRKHSTNLNYKPSVSVIVPARNEEKNIGALLSDLAVQTYPQEKLEIIVVDDASSDTTPEIVLEHSRKFPNIKLVGTHNSKLTYSYKKRAVCEGIMASSGEIIITTDADCRVPSNWLENKAAYFLPGTDLVAGDVFHNSKGLIGALEILEMSGVQAMAAGLMNNGFPVTCNGANLAYRRTAFEKAGGFEDIGSFVSGDDDLLMQKIARNNPSGVIYISGRENAVTTKGATGISDFISRRTRWASKIANYPSAWAVAMLSLFFIFFIGSLLWFMLALAGVYEWEPLLICTALKVLGDFPLVYTGVKNQRREKFLFLFPLAEILHIPYILLVTLRGYFGTFEWSGRKSSSVTPGIGDTQA